MTFLDLYNEVVRAVYPSKVARNIAPIVKNWVRDGVIELQNKVDQLRSGNILILTQEDTYYLCGITTARAPQGWIERVSIRWKDAAGCPQTPGIVVGKEEMLSMKDLCPCSALPQPVNPSIIPPWGFRIPDPSIDRINAVSYRYMAMFDGFLWWYPWINSNEELVVEWKGEKKSWQDTDLIPASFLDERGNMDREVQMLLELYVTGNKDVLDSCKPRDVAFQLYRDRLARYIIKRNEQDKLVVQPPHTPVCKPYISPPLPGVVAKWPTPVFSEEGVPQWATPTFAQEDYNFPVTPQAPAVTIIPDSQSFILSMVVTMSTAATAPYEIRYTVDGSTPNAGSLLYSGPITITATTTIKAVVVKTGFLNSDVVSKTYTLNVPAVQPVTFSPSSSSFLGNVVVTMATTTPAPSEIRYTVNGGEPTPASPLYSGPITLSATSVIKAIAVKAGYSQIPSSTKGYSLVVPTAAVPVFNLNDGHFIDSAILTMATATPGATIRYTTNGSDPTEFSTPYTGPITVTSSALYKAKTFKSGYNTSGLTSINMVLLVPVQLNFNRSEYASALWPEKTATIGSGQNLMIRVNGASCTFEIKYNGVSLLGPVSMGADSTDGNLYSANVFLSGAATELVIPGEGASYFRLGGDTSGETNFNFYIY